MKKLNLANARQLGKTEMKKIVGGLPAPCHCTCAGGSGGAWQYNYEPNGATIAQDIADYCSTGVATCGGCTNIYK
ncbi:MAG: TIGR04149 family rSAM-modified RiPP [Bacteroidetes bacterium]|nr:TIGR04149 family rSAM-modified RiPP [Bacteroidota bacterium]